MERVLDLYAEPIDPLQPVVCFDELSRELPADVREPLPAAPGRQCREAYEYERLGKAYVILFCCPLQDCRQVSVTAQRTY